MRIEHGGTNVRSAGIVLMRTKLAAQTSSTVGYETH